MKRLPLAFAAGVLFTLGLVFSGMTQPRNVRGFLDVFGAWDASLSLVMLGAVVVYALIFWSSRGRAPWCGGSFQLPPTWAVGGGADHLGWARARVPGGDVAGHVAGG